MDSSICHAIAHVLLHASCFTAAMMPSSLANVCTVCWQHVFTSAMNVTLPMSHGDVAIIEHVNVWVMLTRIMQSKFL